MPSTAEGGSTANSNNSDVLRNSDATRAAFAAAANRKTSRGFVYES